MTDPLASPTSAQIKAAREAAGLSQMTAAPLVHVERQTWARWETGLRVMHPAMWELFLLKTRGRPL